MLYRGYEQAVILVVIMDLKVHCDYWEFYECYIRVMSRK